MPPGLFDQAGIVDNEVGCGPLIFKWQLTLLASGELFGRPSATGPNPREPLLRGSVDEHHGVTEVIPSGLQEESGVESDDVEVGISSGLLKLLLKLLSNLGMDNLVQILAGSLLRRISPEDQCGQSPPFDLSLIAKDLVAEPSANLLSDVLPGECCVACGIGVDDADIGMSGEFVRE